MKIFKLFSATILLVLLFSVSVSAQTENEAQFYYGEQYAASGIEEAADSLDEQSKNILNEFGIDISNIESLSGFKPQNVFKAVFNLIKNAVKTPLTVCLSVIGIILIFSLINTTLPLQQKYGGYDIFLCLLLSVIFLSPINELVGGCEDVLKSLVGFLLVFIPALGALLSALGYTALSSAASVLLIGAAELMSQLVSFVLVPISTGVMCLGICAAVSPFGGIMKICGLIKKSTLWCFSVAAGIFSSVLAMQTAVTAAADNITIRTSKAVIGSAFPVMGPVITETLNTAHSCLGLLKSGVGIYGILAIAAIILPLIISIFCWRVGVNLCSVVGEIFEIKAVVNITKAIDFCLSVLVGGMVLVAMLFIISMAVVMKTGG